MAEDDDGADTDQTGPEYRAAVDDMRTSAKWVLGAFAAVGATLFAGLQLTSFGALDLDRDPWRVPVALIGLAAALVGVACAIGALGGFLARGPLTLRGLVDGDGSAFEEARASLAGDRTILGQIDDVDALRLEIADTVRELEAVAPKIAEPEWNAAYTQLQVKFAALRSIARNSLGRASVIIARRRYLRTLRWVAAWAVLTAAGGVAFAFAVAQPDANEELALPVVNGAVEIGERATLLLVEIGVDGAEDGTIVRAVARWDVDDALIFESVFGETDGSAVEKVSTPLSDGRTGSLTIEAFVEGDDAATSVPARLTIVIPTSSVVATTG